MSGRTLFLAWQDQAASRAWFPIGRLDADPAKPLYRFRYIRGAEVAGREAGFPPLEDFPDLDRDYRAAELFPLFKNRVMAPGRPDFLSYLQQLGLSDRADPVEILAAGGGTRATDAFEVFPKLERQQDGSLRSRFFVHGWRYLGEESRRRLGRLEPGEALHVAIEVTNPVTVPAIQVQSEDYVVLGWAPRYLIGDIVAMTRGDGLDVLAKVVRVNPAPAPSKQRLLVELSGPWPGREPMADEEFRPLVS